MTRRSLTAVLAVAFAIVIAFPADAGNTTSELRKLKARVSTLERRMNQQAAYNLLPPTVRRVSANATTAPDANGFVQASVSCASTERVVGGGAGFYTAYGASDHLIQSAPTGAGWTASARDLSGALFAVYALCES